MFKKDAKTHRAARSKGRAFRSLALAGVALTAVGVTTTNALFTDTATLGNNIFSTGSVAISASKPVGLELSMAGMTPGDVKFGAVEVSNSGSIALRYSVTQAATNADSKNLAGNLDMEVKTVAASSNCNAAGWAAGTTVATAKKFNSTPLFGDPAQGAQAGDRTLNAGGSEVLCFRVQLPVAAANTLQGATTTGTFTFSAEQTLNN